ncbi:shikimate kinase [Streptomyces purpureus]|uniref:Shikimate kinase n=1 Tax=Streptomyces purpureus TaxID=1951 RepID=A0A918LN43_9ACTN|nr:shikimate kinase [Streptomyces purpureus]GGT28768.1 shikimate kinase [Streptomyces purpureus]
MNGPLVVLVGPMGSGKSTVGALLAERLGAPYRDTDDDVVSAEGRPIPEIFAADGEAYFREREHLAVRTAVAGHPGVLALGGGAVVDPRTRRILAGQPVVHLSLGVDEALRRVGPGSGRPLLTGDPRARWRALADARRPLYDEVARAVVATDGRTPEEVARAVLQELKLRDE